MDRAGHTVSWSAFYFALCSLDILELTKDMIPLLHVHLMYYHQHTMFLLDVTGALSALADRIKIARGGVGDDINLSIQYMLNCGGGLAGSCWGGSHSGVSLEHCLLHPSFS